MERIARHTFQGVANIIRFNWHFYVLTTIVIGILLLTASFASGYKAYLLLAAILVLAPIIISLLVSFYVYDLSGLYTLKWINSNNDAQNILNIHAGFDETSSLLQQKFPNSKLSVFDFYDPVQHTEVSIKRARKAYPAYPGTQCITTSALPLPDNSIDMIFLIFAAHEIRNEGERNVFFTELNRVLAPGGRLIVTEHLRDMPNFLAYNIGFFHFFSGSLWRKTFGHSGFHIADTKNITPFITSYTLTKNGTPS